MLILPVTAPPADAAALTAAIQASLAEFLTLPNSAQAPATTSGAWPALSSFRVDLSGAGFSPDRLPEPPTTGGATQPAFSAAEFTFAGQGLRGLGGSLDLSVEAGGAEFLWGTHPTGRMMLILGAAERGHVRFHAAVAALETMIREGAAVALKGHGVAVESIQLKLRSEGERALALECSVTASKKVGFFTPSGTVVVRGHAAVDDTLALQLSGLAAEGQGGLGAMAAPMLTPYLQKFEGRRIPLLTVLPPGLALRNIRVSGGEALTLEAEFGRSAT